MDANSQNAYHHLLHKVAEELGNRFTADFPPKLLPDSDYQGAVPDEGVELIAWALTEVVAEVLQSYLNAGSESDAIHEQLGPHIEDEVRGWSWQQVVVDFGLPQS